MLSHWIDPSPGVGCQDNREYIYAVIEVILVYNFLLVIKTSILYKIG